MAIIKSAKKAIRSSARKRKFNLTRQKTLRTTVKVFKQALAGRSAKEAAKLLPGLYQAIDKAAKRGLLKPNAAARKKSRLVAQLKKLS